jgi:hypothetical protein
MASSLGSAQVTLEFLVSSNDGSVYRKYQQFAQMSLSTIHARALFPFFARLNVAMQNEAPHAP